MGCRDLRPQRQQDKGHESEGCHWQVPAEIHVVFPESAISPERWSASRLGMVTTVSLPATRAYKPLPSFAPADLQARDRLRRILAVEQHDAQRHGRSRAGARKL